MTGVVLVHGTWTAKWAQDGTPFRKMLEAQGYRVHVPPFEWSGDISGIPNFTGAQKHSDWKAGGFCLALYLSRLPYEDRNIIAHSHGGQCAAYAAGRSGFMVPIRRLVTVSTPVREDMESTWAAAKPQIGYWLHVASKSGDWMARLGMMFDGHVGWQSRQKQADMNAIIPKIGHTGILSDDKHIGLWQSHRLLDYLSMSDEQIKGRAVHG